MMRLNLLKYQIEVVLKSLELYCYIYRCAYSLKGKKAESNISLFVDTYESIMEQFTTQRNNCKSHDTNKIENLINIFEKFS